jgi:dehydrogenase/reductase SDR family member 12
MWRIEKRIDIPQDLDRVFDYLAHFQHIQEWDPSVLTARPLSPGPPAVGSRFALTVLFGAARVPMIYEITTLTPGKAMVLAGQAASFKAIDRIHFEHIPGGTRLNYIAEVHFPRAPGRLLSAAGERLFRLNAGRAVRRLRTLLSGTLPAPRLTLLTRMADQALLPGALEFTRLGFRLAKNRQPVASALYAGRTIVLTGGTSGIGRAAARALYTRGAHLVVVGRSSIKLEALRRELLAIEGSGSIDTELADLSLLSDVRKLAGRLKARPGSIDVLINNAGALFNDRRETGEGLEMTLATDLLSPYLLTRLLLPALGAADAGRVINVASGGMYTQGIRVNDLQFSAEPYDGPTAYARAKRALVILTDVWARQLAPLGISVHAMHPGWVDTPGLARALPAFHQQLSRWLRTPAEGADTIVWLAASPDAARASGNFWLDRKIRATHVLPGTRESAADRRALVKTLDQLAGL